MRPWLCATLITLLLPLAAQAESEPPAPFYVCGEETKVSWFLQTRHPVPASTCPAPQTLARIPDAQVPAQMALTERVPQRYLKLVEGVLAEKSPEEQRVADRAREHRVRERQREREQLGR